MTIWTTTHERNLLYELTFSIDSHFTDNRELEDEENYSSDCNIVEAVNGTSDSGQD
jgi:hypothetical protein